MKFFLSLALALTTSAAWAQQWSVTGKVSGLADGDTLQLQEVSHIQQPTFGQAIVKNGQFSFSGTLDEPRAVHLLKKGTFGGLTLVLHNEAVSISGSYSEEVEPSTRVGNFDVKISGSTLTDQLQEKLKARAHLDQYYRDTHEPFDDFMQRLYAADEQGDTATVARMKASDEYQRMADEEHKFFTEVERVFTKMVADHRDSWWGPFFLEYNMSYLTEADSTTYNSLSPAAQQSYYGKMVREEIFPNDKAGEPMPDFDISESEQGNKPLNLYAEAKKHKYILIDFWASWCGPCRKEIPNMKKLYADFHSKGFEILSISIDKDVEKWRQACKEEQLPWLSYRDVSGVDALYKVQFIPAMYVLDSQGRLVVMNVRGEELYRKMAELLPE